MDDPQLEAEAELAITKRWSQYQQEPLPKSVKHTLLMLFLDGAIYGAKLMQQEHAKSVKEVLHG